jgi:hypothetical protein
MTIGRRDLGSSGHRSPRGVAGEELGGAFASFLHEHGTKAVAGRWGAPGPAAGSSPLLGGSERRLSSS